VSHPEKASAALLEPTSAGTAAHYCIVVLNGRRKSRAWLFPWAMPETQDVYEVFHRRIVTGGLFPRRASIVGDGAVFQSPNNSRSRAAVDRFV